MSLYWLSLTSSSTTSSSFTNLIPVAVAGGGGGERQRHVLGSSSSSYSWGRIRLLQCINQSHCYWCYPCEKASRPRLFVNCSSSSSDSDSNSNSNSTRGFGSPLPPQSDTDNSSNNAIKKKKKNNKNNNNPNSDSLLAPGLSASRGGRGIDYSPNKQLPSNNDLEFDLRLQAIKRSALEKKKIAQNAQYAAIDYDQSPEAPNSIATTTDTPKTIGLGTKIGIGVAVVVFGFVFALGDFLPTSSDTPSEESTVVENKLSAEDRKALQTRLQEYEAGLSATPKDPTSVEGAAVTLAELGEYSRASSLLEDLTKMKPDDPDAFRLLGEVKYQLKDYQASTAAYKKSAMVSKTINFDVLRGLTNALLAAKKPDEAVQFLLVSRDRLNAKTVAGENSSEADEDLVDQIQVELLLGKAYSDWGHVSNAVSVYDQLISSHPDDFRGYLAKGIILKQNGRAGEAERMFIQARFFAPEKAKALVDRYARK